MANLSFTIFALCPARGEKTAFRLQRETGGYRPVSWLAFRDQSLRFSAYLKKRGVAAGDHVVLISENGPEWGMAALAVMNCGAVLVPVASIASPVEIQNTLRGAKPKFTILSTRISHLRPAEEFLKSEFPEYLVWDLQQEEPLSNWLSDLPPPEPTRIAETDSTAVLIYTSGTTGQPKGVPITHGNILANAQGVIRMVEASENDRLVSVLPLSHMLEFTGGFVIASLVGANVTYVKSLKPEDLIRAMRESRATILIGVPLLFEVIARNLQAKLNDLPKPISKLFARFSSLVISHPGLGPWLFFPLHRALGGKIRYFMAGGSRLQPQVFEFFRGFGFKLLQGYGLTETAPVLTMTNLANAAADHVGTALPGVEVGIFNEQGIRQAVGAEGEIWAKGPNVFRGYLDPAHNKDVFQDGWFRTGDLGNLDAQGILRITGRKKDIIVSGAGKNIYPEEIESTVFQSGLFLEVAVLGLPDSGGHEKVTLVAVPDRTKFLGKSNDDIRRESTQLVFELTRPLSEYKWPQRVEIFFEELPKTSTRKIKKHEVKKLLLAKDQDRVSGAESQAQGAGLDLGDELEGAVAEGIQSITRLDPRSIQLSQSLTKDLGLDSLTFVELVSHVEKKFGLEIEGVDFTAIQTVEDLVRVLEFAAANKKKKPFFSKVFFTDFPPSANGKLAWRIPRRFFNLLLRLMMKWRHGLKVEGLENLQDGGPFVFTPNHSSHFDMLSIATSVPGAMLHRTYAVAAKDYFFNRTWKALGARIFVNAIPFDRKGRVDESMRHCREALDQGSSLIIFPEGTRSPDGKLHDFKAGVGQLLAGHPKARAVPVFIDGAHQIMPKGSNFPGTGKLRLRYGKPVSFADLPAGGESARKIAERLRTEVVKLSKP